MQYKKDIEFLISECWEVRDKPWRLFNTLAKLIIKYSDNIEENSQDWESIIAMQTYADKFPKRLFNEIERNIKYKKICKYNKEI